MQHKSHGDSAYEWKMVWLLAVLFGIVGLDRLVVVYLFPILIPELGLSNTQAGAIASVLALTWALSTYFLGGVSDRHGRKKVLIYSGIFFSLMTWMTGVVKNFTGMLIVRGLLGVGEGGVFSVSVATLAEISTPKRRGLNMGVHQAFFPLLGIGLGPIIATQLSLYMPWEWVFFLLGIPGLILTAMLAKLMREPSKSLPEVDAVKSTPLRSVLRFRNIWVTTIIGSLFQTGLFVFSTFVALYLTQVVGLSLSTTGLIVSGWGFGGFIGMIAVPALSDRWGRKSVLVACATMYGVLMLAFALSHAGPVVMFSILFVAGIFGFGIAPLFLAVIPSESVPSTMTGSAVGVPTGVSELIGGVLMPVVAGGLADMYGLAVPMMVVGAVSLGAAVTGMFLIETAPGAAARRPNSLTLPISTE
ncbi:Predicted arabinose efflux permease, MFS family [Pseudomonas sp. NFIX10]|uniref:MFS transporter n=1 Tax=unclassified Pseudomonas TaxID=196821 RepID=UPI0008E12D2C|nr:MULTISPECIES: MFS transporter [unclassified Pseudomonas]SFB53686.1 Predicted arabinose efflux permease, MFS family [Pseudomonas sp. NFIX10]SFF40541.1 Predicted arabinose efflux permease, MFS family [Pseudomonas sp. NFACC06-1]